MEYHRLIIIVMDRKTAQEFGLYAVQLSIDKHGADAIAFTTPAEGKNTFTYGDVYEAMLNDMPLSKYASGTPVDNILVLNDLYRDKYGRDITKDDIINED